MDALTFLNDISPWYWVAFALALAALEMASFSLFLLWPAAAALITAGVLATFPNTIAEVQIAIFALLSIVMTFVGRYFFVTKAAKTISDNNTLNNRANRIIGSTGVVLESHADQGAVEIDGIRWKARWDHKTTCNVGDTVKVTGVKALVLLVAPVR